MSIITIIENHNPKQIFFNPDENKTLAAILSDNNILLTLTCGGNGFCGKCTVNVNGVPQKACKYIPTGDIIVYLDSKEPVSSSVIPAEKILIVGQKDLPADNNKTCNEVSVAIDIGSTSISLALVSHSNTNEAPLDLSTILNPTFEYGADILSRAQSSINGSRDAMAALLRNRLNNEINKLLTRNHLSENNIKSVYIACNLIMTHILLALDCSQLVSFPFKSAEYHCSNMYHGIPVYIIPAFSPYVGGDIVSGIYYLNPPKDSAYIFLDLGTNAEIVVSNKNGEMFCSSAAAGPAFEGAGISCGQAYVKGAINSVTIANMVSYKTIGNKIPTGICGSGILDTYAGLIANHIVDENKTLIDKYIDSGFTIAPSLKGPIAISQKDIRQIQLAVSAIASGIQILLKHARLEISDIDKVYISGSFGKSLKLETIKTIGILPTALADASIIEFTGNTSLLGAIHSAIHGTIPDNYASLIKRCTEIELANDSDFNVIFINNL